MADVTKGDIVRIHCCDVCSRKAGIKPKRPADSGSRSLYCEVCGHYNIGSKMVCQVDDWLILKPLRHT